MTVFPNDEISFPVAYPGALIHNGRALINAPLVADFTPTITPASPLVCIDVLGRIYKLGEGKVLEILSTDWTDLFEEKIRKSA